MIKGSKIIGRKMPPMSKEQKAKLRAIRLGKKHSEETKRKIGLACLGNKSNTGRNLSIEHKQKISISLKEIRIGKLNPFFGRKHSEETKRKISERVKAIVTPELRKKMGDAHRGEKNSTWKGGVTTSNELMRKSTEYRLLRTACFERDSFACTIGGKEHGNKLHMHHIKPFSLFPELRLALDNVQTLCVECHKKTETYAGKVKNYQLVDEN